MALTPSTMLPLSTTAPAFSLPDTTGATVALENFKDASAVLVMFLCNHCPFVKHVRSGVAQLVRDYQARGLAAVGINSNDAKTHPDDGPDKMKQEAADAGYTFPYLYDESQAVAKAYKAACTPDFFLFNRDRKLVYRGQFDDSRDLIAFLSVRTSTAPIATLDVGTGTALIPIELCTRPIDVRVTAVDLAAHMLQLAQRNVIRAGFQRVIKLEQIDAKSLPYANGDFDAVISNSIIHHIPEPIHSLREMVRVLRPGGKLFVRDLLRPADDDAVLQLVETYAGDANLHQRQMFHNSLHAALTLDEVRTLLRDLHLPPECVAQTSDRHWTIRAAKT